MKNIPYLLLTATFSSLIAQASPNLIAEPLNLDENAQNMGRPSAGSRESKFSSGGAVNHGKIKISNATARATHGAGYHTTSGIGGSGNRGRYDGFGGRGSSYNRRNNGYGVGGRYNNVRGNSYWSGRYSWWMPQYVWPVNVTSYYGFFDNVIPVVQGLNIDPSVISDLITEIQNLRAQIQNQEANGVDDTMREQMANLINKLREYKPDLDLQSLFGTSSGANAPDGMDDGAMPANMGGIQ